ncbi:MAG: hypothetical protein RRY11_08775 [Terrisporobacter sp.]
MKNYLLKLLKENEKSIKVFAICLIIGLATGFIVFNFLNVDNKKELITSVTDTLDICKDFNFEKVSVLQNGIKSNLILMCMFVIIALTVVAPIIICVMFFIKGFAIGIFTAVIFSIFGFWNGILVNVLINILPNLVYLPAYIFMGIKTIDFHYFILDNNKVKEKLKQLVILVYYFAISMSFFFLSIVIEQLLFSIVLKIYMKN